MPEINLDVDENLFSKINAICLLKNRRVKEVLIDLIDGWVHSELDEF